MRTVSSTGFMQYAQPAAEQTIQQAQQATIEEPSQGLLQEYGGIAKNILSPTSTSLAEGYNKIYDLATGFEGAPGTNLATGTTSSGTFGGTNITNAAYSYAGGKLANELFDNKGYSEAGGTIGAGVGASAAVGSSALGTYLGSLGWAAGPVGAIAGAVLGAAVGSLFGSDDISDSSFRTYSGEMGDEVSDFNKLRTTQEGFYDQGRDGYFQQEAGLPYNPSMITFAYGQDLSSGVLDNSIAETETPFGKYTVALVDDMKNEDELSFSQSWVDRVNQVDTAFANILTPEEIAKAKEGLSGTAQASHEWEKSSQANVATADMLIDRYRRIAQLAGRDDIEAALLEVASGETGRDNGGIDTLSTVIQQFTPQASPVAGQSGVATRAATTPSQTPTRRNYSISRPEGIINPAMEIDYVG